jgi:hypothetical protein
VAAEATRSSVRTDQRKARCHVFFDLTLRLPSLLPMTRFAVAAELSEVHIFMAASATLSSKGSHWPTVVMATQALGLLVSSFKSHTGFSQVVEFEIRAYLIPLFSFMASRAVAWEIVVWNYRTIASPPSLWHASCRAGLKNE